MMLARYTRAIGATVVLAMLSLLIFEAYAVWDASRRTPQILAIWLAKPQALPLSALSAEQKDILLQVEDPAFYTHKGIDLSSPGQGMTTITQGLVKFLYFDGFQPGFAKIEQSLIARFVLDQSLSKDQQLALFINHAYFGSINGREVRGLAGAAEIYSGKPFDQLTRDDYIGLIAMLIGPNEVRPDNKRIFDERVSRIKALLDGKCQPQGVFDPTYKACATRS